MAFTLQQTTIDVYKVLFSKRRLSHNANKVLQKIFFLLILIIYLSLEKVKIQHFLFFPSQK